MLYAYLTDNSNSFRVFSRSTTGAIIGSAETFTGYSLKLTFRRVIIRNFSFYGMIFGFVQLNDVT